MKSLFESFRKFALNEEQDQDVKNAVEQKLKDEGGAAGMEPLLDAAKEVSEEMTEEEYLKIFVGEHNRSIELDKEMNGTWTTEEIIDAMKSICPEAWNEN